jgi:hypothetical protein
MHICRSHEIFAFKIFSTSPDMIFSRTNVKWAIGQKQLPKIYFGLQQRLHINNVAYCEFFT